MLPPSRDRRRPHAASCRLSLSRSSFNSLRALAFFSSASTRVGKKKKCRVRMRQVLGGEHCGQKKGKARAGVIRSEKATRSRVTSKRRDASAASLCLLGLGSLLLRVLSECFDFRRILRRECHVASNARATDGTFGNGFFAAGTHADMLAWQ